MSISKKEVLYIAQLAKLHLDEEELAKMCGEMDNLIDFAQGLADLDAQDIEPRIIEETQNTLADDIQGNVYELKELLANAPEIKDDYFTVPKVID